MEADIVIHKSKSLGNGSYGAVFKAQLNELPCAAKILHPILLETNDPNGQKIIERFYQECDLMKDIAHPNIVQYLGTTRDAESDLPVLLMELLDESLTSYLDRADKAPPYHTQVNLSHDVALAIAHLHSKGIVHRDLSSNNILLIAGSKAKVSDFGMSKILDAGGTFPRHSLTQLPGTQVYMPPEAFLEPPNYSNKIDCFSFGPLIIQLLTTKFPDPGPRFIMATDVRSPVGISQIPVLEEDRRRNHIDLVDSLHPLMPIARQCLKYRPEERPTAHQLCQQIAQLKEQDQYLERKELPNILPTREIQDLQQQLQCCEETIRTKDIEIRANNVKIDLLTSLLQTTEEYSSKQAREIENLKGQLLLNKNDIVCPKNESVCQEIASEFLHVPSPVTVALESDNSELSYNQLSKPEWTIEEAPYRVSRGQIVVCSQGAYFRGSNDQTVCKYDTAVSEWSILTSCLYPNSSLAVIEGLLTTIGGSATFIGKIIEPQSDLYSFVSGPGPKAAWKATLPSMPTKRYDTSAICYENTLIVAGGSVDVNTYLSTVEVLFIHTRTWFTATNLPRLFSCRSMAISDGHIYFQSWSDRSKDDKFLSCSVPSLLSSLTPSSLVTKLKSVFSSSKPAQPVIWKHIASVPVRRSTLVSLGPHLLAVGGIDRDSTSDCVFVYNPMDNAWRELFRLPEACHDCLAVAFSDRTLAIIGGYDCHSKTIRTIQLACF